MSSGSHALSEPISGSSPCGEDLEDTQLLASFDAFRLFGQSTPLGADTEWRAIRDGALEALGRSKDFRLLAHYGAAALRTDGLAEFFASLRVARDWLRDYWDEVFPRIDDDAVLRKNALSCLADRMAVVDGLRRVPVIVHRQLGAFSLRDLDIATGQLPPPQEGEPPTESQLLAALAATPLEELSTLEQSVAAAAAAAQEIVEIMRSRGGFDAVPDFEPLTAQLERLQKYLHAHLAGRAAEGSGVDSPAEAAAQSPAAGAATVAVGAIRSRQDAIAALEAVATFFRRNEPSSPVPLLLDRAKRLVSKSFLEVLEDIAPDGIAQARVIGGVRADDQ